MNGYDNYRDDAIMSADPLTLIQLLYEGALSSVREARQHLRDGDIMARGRAVSKTCAILTELAMSLDHERGGELSRNLAELYDYMQHQLTNGHSFQTEAPFADVERLLADLLEGWASVARQASEVPAALVAAQYEMSDSDRVSCLC